MNKTEMRNERSTHIDEMELKDALRLINDENSVAIRAVNEALAEIEQVCLAMVEAVKRQNRIFYIGAGTSGRLGVMDAAECPPTFGVSRDLFTGIIAGGTDCMFRAAEAQEDDPDRARTDLESAGLKSGDVLIGISASGGAAYVVGALRYAKEIGALPVALVNNKDTLMQKEADITIVLDTGAEVITGSTRMKAGTSQKIVLNMLSTMTMVKCGCVYENMMINLCASNVKLRARMIRILCEILQTDAEEAEVLLEKADWSLKRAITLYREG